METVKEKKANHSLPYKTTSSIYFIYYVKDSRDNLIDFFKSKKFYLLSFFCELEIGMLINKLHYKLFSSVNYKQVIKKN